MLILITPRLIGQGRAYELSNARIREYLVGNLEAAEELCAGVPGANVLPNDGEY